MTRFGLLAVVVLFGLVLAPFGGRTAEAQTSNERYIVVLRSGAGPRAVAQDHALQAQHVYRHALNGFSAVVPPGRLNALQRDPRVALVEIDQPVRAFAQTTPTGVTRIFADTNGGIDIDGTDDYRVDVDVAVIDTGIDLDHPDLNVVASTSCMYTSGGGPPWSRPVSCGTGGDDDNGHGTHVAGTIGALDNGTGVVGVAPGARLWAVKVLDSAGSGYLSYVIAGIDYVTANADSIEVANMSLGCQCQSDAMDQAISSSVAKGVVYAVAAGNDDMDAASFSPANHPKVITVSALADFDGAPGGGGAPTCRTDQDDTLADFSNWGNQVEIAAPGVCILSTWPGGGYNTISGTSMASPHVAGAAALLASRNNPSNETDANNIRSTLVNNGNTNWIDDSGDGAKEPLLDVSNTTVFNPNLVAGSGGGTANSAPTASFTYTCTDLACSFDGTASADSDGTIASYAWDFGDGSTDSGATASHTYAAGGTYTVTLTVTDGDGAPGSDSKSVTVASSGGGEGTPGTAHVSDLDGSGINNGSTWTANVTVTVRSADGNLVGGATVGGHWNGNGPGTAACGPTGTDGQCTVSLSGIPKKQSSVTFTVDNISHATLGYDASANTDPDGDSSGTSISVNKP